MTGNCRYIVVDAPITPVFSKLELIRLPRVSELFRRCPDSPRKSLFFWICGVSCSGKGCDISRIRPRICDPLELGPGGRIWNEGSAEPEAASAARDFLRSASVSDCIRRTSSVLCTSSSVSASGFARSFPFAVVRLDGSASALNFFDGGFECAPLGPCPLVVGCVVGVIDVERGGGCGSMRSGRLSCEVGGRVELARTIMRPPGCSSPTTSFHAVSTVTRAMVRVRHVRLRFVAADLDGP